VDVNEKIRAIMNDRGWTEYKLSKESGLSQSTIANLFRRDTTPSIYTLEAICAGFGITLAQFFVDGNWVELSTEQRDLFEQWTSLTPKQKQVVYDIISAFNNR
jgi:transcriptional regulator with XRE-family HTH domain